MFRRSPNDQYRAAVTASCVVRLEANQQEQATVAVTAAAAAGARKRIPTSGTQGLEAVLSRLACPPVFDNHAVVAASAALSSVCSQIITGKPTSATHRHGDNPLAAHLQPHHYAIPRPSVHAVHPTSRLQDKIQTPHIPQIIRLHIAIRRRGKTTSLPRGSPASLRRPGPGLTAFSSTFPRAGRHRQRTDSAKNHLADHQTKTAGPFTKSLVPKRPPSPSPLRG